MIPLAQLRKEDTDIVACIQLERCLGGEMRRDEEAF